MFGLRACHRNYSRSLDWAAAQISISGARTSPVMITKRFERSPIDPFPRRFHKTIPQRCSEHRCAPNKPRRIISRPLPPIPQTQDSVGLLCVEGTRQSDLGSSFRITLSRLSIHYNSHLQQCLCIGVL